MFGNVTTLVGLHVLEKYRTLISMMHACSRHAAWDPHKKDLVDPRERRGAGGAGLREIGNLLPNNRRPRRTCYALCHTLYPVSAAHTSIFRMDSNSTCYCRTQEQDAPASLALVLDQYRNARHV